MKKLKQILTGAAAASFLSIAISFHAFAARIAFSDPAAEAGREVTVNMKITAGEGENINSSNVMLSYDPKALQFLEGTGSTGGAGSIRVVGEAQGNNSRELVFTLKFRALKPGNTAIAISTQEVYNKDGQLVNVSQAGKSVVAITGEAVVSSTAELANLQISPGVLSPAFSPDVDTYTATVSGSVDTVNVNAPAADGGASVEISGNEGLQTGENEILCVVTAQDGQTKKTYRILVTKVEGDEVPMAERVSLRTYDRTVTVLSSDDAPNVPEGFVQCSVNIDGQAVRGWIWNDPENPGGQPEYCIFYAANEEGERGFYRYDLKEKTLQRYFRDPTGGNGLQAKLNTTAEEYNSLLQDYETRFWMIIGLIVLAVFLLVVIIILVAGRGQRDDFIEKREARDDEWEAEKRMKRQRLSREEAYLRGLEEDEAENGRGGDLMPRRAQYGSGGTTRSQGLRTAAQAEPGGRETFRGSGMSRSAGLTGSRAGQAGNMAGSRGSQAESRGSFAGPETRQERPRTGGAQGARSGVPAGNGFGGRAAAPTRRNPHPEIRENRKYADRGLQADDDFEVIDLK